MRWPWLDNLCEQDKLLQAVICAVLSGWEVTHISWEQLWAHCWVEAVADGPGPIGEMQENLETHGYRCFDIPSIQNFIGSLQLLRWEFTVDTVGEKKRAVFPTAKSEVGGISFSFWHEYNMIFLMIAIQTS